MRSELKFCAAILALAALATPVALSQTPASPTPDKRILPTAAVGYAEYQGEVSNIMSKELKSADDLDKALNTFGGPELRATSLDFLFRHSGRPEHGLRRRRPRYRQLLRSRTRPDRHAQRHRLRPFAQGW